MGDEISTDLSDLAKIMKLSFSGKKLKTVLVNF